MKTIIENATIITMNVTRQIIDSGYIVFENGLIQEVKEGKYTHSDVNDVEVINGEDTIIVPGLVNAHTHSYANIVRGSIENIPLEYWMLYIMAEGKKMTLDDHMVSATLGSIEMLKGGTTTFLDHVALDYEGFKRVAQEYKQLGIRPVLTPMFGDRSYGESLPEVIKFEGIGSRPHGPAMKSDAGWKDLIDMVEQVVTNVKDVDNNIYVGVGPSGPQRSTDDLLIASMDLAERHDIPWHTHLLETKHQEAAADRLYNKSMVSHLNDIGILQERVSLAHSVWISEADISLIKEKNASIIHNPYSNLLLGSGIAPMIPIKKAGINIGIGTDGSNCSGSQSMFESMKLASVLSNVSTEDYDHWIKAQEILEMATLGGAKAIGMDDYIGSLTVGKSADFIVLDKKTNNFAPLNNIIWQLVYGRAENSIASVYVSGEKVVDNGAILTIDEKSFYEKAITCGKELMDKLSEDYENNKLEEKKVKDLIEQVKKFPSKRIN